VVWRHTGHASQTIVVYPPTRLYAASPRAASPRARKATPWDVRTTINIRMGSTGLRKGDKYPAYGPSEYGPPLPLPLSYSQSFCTSFVYFMFLHVHLLYTINFHKDY